MIKNYTLKLINYSKAYLLVGFLLVSGLSYGALSGTYTIDKGSAASSTNYQSFASIFGDLYNGTRTDGGTSNGSGVSGPVVINVVSASGPYTERVTIYQISGVSATNTIKVNGNGNTLQFTATSTSSAETVYFNGADYVTIDDLTIISLSSSIGRCVNMANDAQYNTVSNCKLQMPNMTSTSSANFYFGITNGTSSTQTYGNAGRENTLTKCTLSARASGGPYSAIAIMDESSGSTVKKNYLTDNIIRDFYIYGIWTYYAFQQVITGNEIYNTGSVSTTKYGMYNYCYNKGGDYTIENNYIHDLMGTTTQYGIYHYSYLIMEQEAVTCM